MNPAPLLLRRPLVPRPIDGMLARLAWMRAEGFWPVGPRCLWTDALGLVLQVSLHRLTKDARYLDEAESLVAAVERELLPRGGEPLERGERFHALAVWIFALGRLGRIAPAHRQRAIELARGVHERFVLRGVEARWNRISGSDAIHEPGPLDSFLGYVVYRSLDEPELGAEIADMREMIERSYRDLVITQDLGLGTMLWLTHFHPEEPWACLQWGRCLRVLEHLWVDPPGCFIRQPGLTTMRSALANHGISIGLQAVAAMPERVEKLRRYFQTNEGNDDYRSITQQVMACCADLPGELLCTPGSA